MKNCDTILKAGILITQNDDREVLSDAAIAIDKGLIAAIGPAPVILEKWQAPQILDYSHMLVMPGLINGHTHAAMTFLRGKADDLPLMDWLHSTIFPTEARLTPEIVHLGTLLGYAEMLRTGTIACVDMYMFEEEVFRAAEIAGIRCLGGEAVFAFPSASCRDYKVALERTEDLAKKYRPHPRLSVAVNPHSVYTTTPQILEECMALAERENIPCNIHLAETPAETAQSLELHGKRPLGYLAEIAGSTPIIAAHIVDLAEDELALLADKGIKAVHNPGSNMKLASGAAPVTRLLELGGNVALGTDGAASNNQLNMFAEMRLTALLHKLAQNDPASLPAGTVLDMATRGGAEVFGDRRMGRLEPGSHADCIALDLSSPNMQPLHNPISQAIYAASGYECRMTMIAGEVVYKDGKFSGFDYESLLKEIPRLKDFCKAAQPG